MSRCPALVIAAAIGGCAPHTAPPAGTAYDGSYIGLNRLIRGAGFQCGAPSYAEQVTVTGGRFDYPFAVSPPRNVPVPVPIAVDGTFAGRLQYGTEDYTPLPRYRTAWVIVTGRIADGTLEASITDYRCTRRLTARLG